MNKWKPNKEILNEVENLIEESKKPNTKIQKNILNKMKEMNLNIPDLNNYLAFIVCLYQETSITNRRNAGLILKNNILQTQMKDFQNVIEYVKEQMIIGISDPEPKIQQSCGIVISSIIQNFGIRIWPNLFDLLYQMIQENQNQSLIIGSLDCILKILEDQKNVIKTEFMEQNFELLIQKLLNYLHHENKTIQNLSLSSLIEFTLLNEYSLSKQIENFIHNLIVLAQGENDKIKRKVCHAFNLLLTHYSVVVEKYINEIIESIMKMMENDDPKVSLEACEFWFFFSQIEHLKHHLVPFLEQLIPRLLESMVFTSLDIQLTSNQLDGENFEKFNFYSEFIEERSKTKTSLNGKEKEGISTNNQNNKINDENTGFDGKQLEDEDDEDDLIEDDVNGEWNLRKSAANAIEKLSVVYQDELFGHLLPYLEHILEDEQVGWEHKEAAILSIGAISEGCLSAISQHLPKLMVFLAECLKHPHHLVRVISCWTISRYIDFLAVNLNYNSNSNDNQNQSFQNTSFTFENVLKDLLICAMDRIASVQNAACSALAIFIRSSQEKISSFLQDILEMINFSFQKYKKKNYKPLYLVITALCETLDTELSRTELMKLIMDPLVQIAQSVSDEDDDLIPLFQTLGYIASNIGAGFEPYLEYFWKRSLKIIDSYVIVNSTQNLENFGITKDDLPDKIFMFTSLEFLASIIEGASTNETVRNLMISDNLPSLLFSVLSDPEEDIIQSALALLGVVAINNSDLLQLHIKQEIPLLVFFLKSQNLSVRQNSCWAIGKVCFTFHNLLVPYVEHILEELQAIISASPCSYFVQNFFDQWSALLREIKNKQDKLTAHFGFCKLINNNISVVVSYYESIFATILFYQFPSLELLMEFKDILFQLQQLLIEVGEWDSFYNNINEEYRAILLNNYDIK
ncbi:hypothetical protein M0811_04127 [Anaeramoeba ignava]|uniref:Uncharacterized protein n=1 Tax=Anaeramoeba ignava TaxID=1746090 RepID=A0A9Q0RII3_ANAIG|nr:hypothetical protein M0811_04127 [Anaeramoeba ignava]